ncbi:MAG: neutral/alkaline non-lysosomal ceramidase N-terminal domain-containing protein [Phycisphaeraceae bacterium]|nr:neutral/alkaline non-lysosomal ceramidase N-terminal domain-containing protein [Phycisphaeraceae bacterium]
MTATFRAGAAAVDLTPTTPQFLYGYPHEPRISTGVHDRLWASALAVGDGTTTVVMVGTDLIWVPFDSCCRARDRVAAATGIPPRHVAITATHTHSGPMTANMLVAESDPAVPHDPDPAYVKLMEDAIVAAATQAVKSMRPAKAGLVMADAGMVGTNRRDPKGPAMPQAPVLAVRDAKDDAWIGLMVICNMHPTVLHEDSKLISGDFPGLTRLYLQEHVVGKTCPVVYHMGTAGNQSPRHVTRGNTFAEAKRLGDALGQSIAQALQSVTLQSSLPVTVKLGEVTLPQRVMPTVTEAQAKLKKAVERLDHLRKTNAPRTETRTAECDWFGAEETVTMAKAHADGRLEAMVRDANPFEVVIVGVGPWSFVGWPGEVFVEFGMAVRKHDPHAFVMTLTNAETLGYLVTAEAVAEGGYEASNAVCRSPDSGNALVAETLRLIQGK